jgi:hypothetical protein
MKTYKVTYKVCGHFKSKFIKAETEKDAMYKVEHLGEIVKIKVKKRRKANEQNS